MTSRLVIRLTDRCSNQCLFCAQEGLDLAVGPFGVERLRALLAERRQDTDELTVVGGEPSLLPDLDAYVAVARAAGMRRVGVQSNGGPLAAAGRVAGLASAGLTDLHLSLHGATPGIHDYHTGIPGSFASLMATAGSAVAAGLDVVVSTVVTRSNLRNLHELPRLLSALRVRGWSMVFPRVAGRAGRHAERLVPRLGMAAPFMLHGLEAATRLALPTWVQGVPACALGPQAGRALAEAEKRTFGTPCERCEARPACAGVDDWYLGRFGSQELVPRALAAPTPANETFARMFVGIGPLAPAAAAETLLPPKVAGLVSLGGKPAVDTSESEAR